MEHHPGDKCPGLPEVRGVSSDERTPRCYAWLPGAISSSPRAERPVAALGSLAVPRLAGTAGGNRAIAFAMLCLTALSLGLLLVPQVWERYWSAAVPITILAALTAMERSGLSRKVVPLQYGYLILIGLACFVWQLRT